MGNGQRAPTTNMAVNQAVVATLNSRPVPLDLQCVLPQATADAIAQVMQVVGLASQIASPQGVTPITNNVGQQALSLAQSLQQITQTLQGQVVQRRLVALRTSVPSGNAQVPYQFSPAMPTDSYEVRVMFTTAAGHTAAPKWRMLDGSQTTNSFTLLFDDLPAATLTTVVVEELRSVVL